MTTHDLPQNRSPDTATKPAHVQRAAPQFSLAMPELVHVLHDLTPDDLTAPWCLAFQWRDAAAAFVLACRQAGADTQAHACARLHMWLAVMDTVADPFTMRSQTCKASGAGIL